MTLAEFKAWFEGFTEDMAGAPTEKQFKKIKARVAEITGTPITERYFFDHYWPRQYWSTAPYATYTSVGLSQYGVSSGIVNIPLAASFSSTNAMNALGKADAAA